MLLIANHDISIGAEITFSYECSIKKTTQDRLFHLPLRGFECNCQACSIPDVAAKLDKMVELDATIFNLGSNGKIDRAIRVGKQLIKLYDKLRCPDISYSRTYYDLFQVAISKRKTLKEGRYFIKKAYEHGSVFYADGDEHVNKFKKYMLNPEEHRYYRLND